MDQTLASCGFCHKPLDDVKNCLSQYNLHFCTQARKRKGQERFISQCLKDYRKIKLSSEATNIPKSSYMSAFGGGGGRAY